MIDVLKIKSIINDKERTYFYNIIWIIKEIDQYSRNNELMIMKYECTNENEFKILIRAIIIGFLMISDYSKIILEVNEYV